MKRKALADLPLYADDHTLGCAIMGRARAGEWKAIAPLLEAKGLPQIDELHGGRYVPAVEKFYDFFNGIAPSAPLAPDGMEDLGSWNAPTTRSRRRASSGSGGRADS